MQKIEQGQKAYLEKGAAIQLLDDTYEMQVKGINRDDPLNPSITFRMKDTGEEFTFTGTGPHIIGRSEESDHIIRFDKISKMHSAIQFEGEHVVYSHLARNDGHSSVPVRNAAGEIVQDKIALAEVGKPDDSMNKMKKGDMVILTVGTKVRLLETRYEMEVIAAGRNESQQPFVTFRTAGTNEEFTFTGAGPHTIGRESDCTQQVKDKKVSRKHAKVHFSGDVPIYSNYARNEGYTTGVVYRIEERAEDAGATVNRTVNNANVDVKLKPGMQIQFHPHLPVYEVAALTIDPKHVRLEQVGTINKDYPRSMEATGEIPVSLGARNMNYTFSHMEMPGEYALLGWSFNDMTFQLSLTRGPMPTILPGKEFLAEQQDILAKLEVTDRKAAEEEIANIKRLLGNIDKYQANMEKVQDFEGSIVDSKPHYAGGALTEESQIGYVVWLQSLAAIYKDSLTDKEQDGIAKMSGVLKVLAADRAEVRDMENYEIPPYKRATRDAASYAPSMREYVGAKVAELKKDGEAYLVAGFHGHHVVARLQGDEQKGYNVTIYNAGAEAIPAPQGPDNPKGELVMGTYEHKLKAGVKPEEFIRSLTEKKIRPRYDEGYLDVSMELQNAMEPPPLRFKAVKPQQTGNCTTRSTRHALEDVLGEELVQRLGKNVADPEFSKAEDLKAALQMRMAALAKGLREEIDQTIVGKIAPAESIQVDRPRGNAVAAEEPSPEQKPKKGGGFFGNLFRGWLGGEEAALQERIVPVDESKEKPSALGDVAEQVAKAEKSSKHDAGRKV